MKIRTTKPKKSFSRSERKLEFTRILTFSDGVFAIAMTLLVVTIQIPDIPSGLVAKELPDAFERIARQVMLRRGQLKLTQKQLAKRVGTSHSVISRIESGQHSTSVTTLQRLAKALNLKLIIDFETDEQSEANNRRKAVA